MDSIMKLKSIDKGILDGARVVHNKKENKN